MGVAIPTVPVADTWKTLREYDQSYRSLGSLPELGKLTGARKATGASDADRGYRRAGVNFQFFPDVVHTARQAM